MQITLHRFGVSADCRTYRVAEMVVGVRARLRGVWIRDFRNVEDRVGIEHGDEIRRRPVHLDPVHGDLFEEVVLPVLAVFAVSPIATERAAREANVAVLIVTMFLL